MTKNNENTNTNNHSSFNPSESRLYHFQIPKLKNYSLKCQQTKQREKTKKYHFNELMKNVAHTIEHMKKKDVPIWICDPIFVLKQGSQPSLQVKEQKSKTQHNDKSTYNLHHRSDKYVKPSYLSQKNDTNQKNGKSSLKKIAIENILN